jgi:hypothetical protein
MVTKMEAENLMTNVMLKQKLGSEEPFEEAADLITNESREEAEGPQLTLIQSA